jgi:SAM-dependent methyltransferase
MASDDRWLRATWPFVREHLPPPPSRVLEIGCGIRGGFVPALAASGYRAVGVDPQAPEGANYARERFEDFAITTPVDAVVACTSLHHVEDVDAAVGRIVSALVPGGTVLVVEWALERFDEATARWCFDRLADHDAADDETTWLHRHRDGWTSAGGSWDTYFHGWVAQHGLHSSAAILRALDRRLDPIVVADGPYYFANLHNTDEDDERAAIAAGRIRAGRIEYAATSRLLES